VVPTRARPKDARQAALLDVDPEDDELDDEDEPDDEPLPLEGLSEGEDEEAEDFADPPDEPADADDAPRLSVR
jgi:hypothetical protein